MKSSLIPSLAFAGVIVLSIGCQPPVKLTPEQTMALRQAQSRNYEIPLDLVFKATLTYLQDNMYQVKQASKETGLINAYKTQDLSAGQKFWGAFWAGGSAKKGDTYDITFTFEATDEANSHLRCNITHGVSTLGFGQSDVQPVTDPNLYKNLLDGLSLEINRRNMTESLRKSKPTETSATQPILAVPQVPPSAPAQ